MIRCFSVFRPLGGCSVGVWEHVHCSLHRFVLFALWAYGIGPGFRTHRAGSAFGFRVDRMYL